MTKKSNLIKLRSLLASLAAVATMSATSPVSSSAQNITAQELMDQLINGNKVVFDDETTVEIIKKAITMNGANLLGEKANAAYQRLLNNTSKDRKADLMDLAEFSAYLLEENICDTFPKSLQIENVAYYTRNELKKLGINEIDSYKREYSKITLDAYVKMATQNRELMEESYVIIYNTDIGTYDELCYDINPATAVEVDPTTAQICVASVAGMLLAKPKQKKKTK